MVAITRTQPNKSSDKLDRIVIAPFKLEKVKYRIRALRLCLS